MQPRRMRSAVGLLMTVAGSAVTGSTAADGLTASELQAPVVVVPGEGFALPPPPASMGEDPPLEDADVEELAGTERSCLTPRWGESEACAAFALASGATVEIALLEVKDTDGKDQDGEIHFRLYDVKGQTTVFSKALSVGAKISYVNTTSGLLDLVVHAKNTTAASKQTIRFTYEKK